MNQQETEQRGPHCLLCRHPVQQQGDVCTRCESKYIALGRALIEYSSQLEPILSASPYKHIGAPMRFVPDVYFFLQELETELSYQGRMITHRLSVVSLAQDEQHPFHQDYWYGHTIPSTFMVATINASSLSVGFPEEADYFVPIESWKPVSHAGTMTPSDGERPRTP